MQFENLLVQDRNAVRTITLNRPDSLNSITYDVLEELESAVAQSDFDDGVRALVLKGAGRAFCAGDDLHTMGTNRTPLPEHDAVKRAALGYPRFILALRRSRKPVIAQVHGYAMGAGCDLALACDIVFATHDARFGFVFARRGMLGGTALLVRLVGYQKACELLFGGEDFSAAEAQRLGLVNFVGTAEEVDKRVEIWSEKLATGPTTAITLMKKALNQSMGQSLEQAVDTHQHLIALMYHTDDYAEGKRAFAEKRTPRYRGW
jgi:enoyl-CoA hydratase/carnithine racemase